MIQTLFHITPLALVVLLAAGYRITRFAIKDDFPPLMKIRAWLHAKFPPSGSYVDGVPNTPPKRVQEAAFLNTGRGTENRWFIQRGHWLGDLTSCQHCFGFWVGLAEAVLYGFFPTAAFVLALPWAIAAGISYLSSKED